MYREGQEVLERGLSRGSRVFLGLVAGLFCAGMAVMAPSSGSPIGFYLFAVFCGSIALACLFTGRWRRLIGRFIGAAVFAASAWYFVGQLSAGTLISGSRSEPSILNALIFLLVAGLPGLLFALFGRFTWRRSQGAAGEP
jgi:hypothetical protein